MEGLEVFECESVIVGAGVAGITSAINLLSNNYENFLVLEADDHIGGRCKTIQIDQGFLDLGAQFIHGQIGNPIFDLALKHNLIENEDRPVIDLDEEAIYKEGKRDENLDEKKELLNTMNVVIKKDELLNENRSGTFFVNQTGEKISLTVANKIYKVCNDCMQTARKYRLKHRPDRRVGDFLYNKYLRLIEKEFKIDFGNKRMCVERVYEEAQAQFSFGEFKALLDGMFFWRCKWENIEKGCNNLLDLSLNNFGAYKKLKGRQVVKTKYGYEAILKQLIAPHEHKFNSKLKLQHSLNKILMCENLKQEQSGNKHIKYDCSHCAFTNDPNKIVLLVNNFKKPTLPQDLVIICKHVICTMSLGCLKKIAGNLVEPESFMPRQKLTAIKRLGFGSFVKIFLIYEKPFWPENFNGLHLIWFPDESFSMETFTWQHNIRYSKPWYENICSFQSVNTHPNAIVVLVSDADEIEKMNDEAMSKMMTHLLNKFLQRTDIPQPRKIIKTDWKSNPFVSGVYSHVPFEAEQSDFDQLESPISFNDRPFVMFAGEHTHREHFSTVHGAYLTGLRESNRILDFSKLNA